MVSLKTEPEFCPLRMIPLLCLPRLFVQFVSRQHSCHAAAPRGALGIQGWLGHSLALGLPAPWLGKMLELLHLHVASRSMADVLCLGSRWCGRLLTGSVTALVGDEDEGHVRWKEQHVRRPQTVPLRRPSCLT